MKNRETKILKLLAEIAKDSSPVGRARVSAAIVYKNEIIAIGTNKNKTDPFQLKFNQYHNEKRIYIHAEIDAIKKSLHYISVDKLKKCTLYVCRVKNKNGKMVSALAKPCSGCTAAIVVYGISTIVYTIESETNKKISYVKF